MAFLAISITGFAVYNGYKVAHYYKLLASWQGGHVMTPYQAQLKPFIDILTMVTKNMPIKDGQLFIYQNIQLFSLYTELRVIAPTKWLDPDIIDQYNFDRSGEKFKSILQNIKINKTRFILDFSLEVGSTSAIHTLLWKRLLRDYYIKTIPLPCILTQLSDRPSNMACGWLYVRKDDPYIKNITELNI